MQQADVRPLWQRGLWAALAGALHAGSLSPWAAGVHAALPYALQTLAFAGLVMLLSATRRPRDGALLAWVYGSVWLIGATGWMFVSLHRFGGLPAWLAALAVYLLCVALSLYLAVAGWAWARWRTGLALPDAVLLAAVWLLAELARAYLFTGFPWGASGYGLLDSPFVALAPWVGVYGMGAIWAAGVAVICLLARQTGWLWRSLIVLGTASLGLLGPVRGPQFTEPHGAPLRVSLLQGNVPQDEKFVPTYQGAMLAWHAQQLLAADADLVVAPETAIPLLPSQLPNGYWEGLVSAFAADGGRHALIGLPLGDFEQGYTNSVAGLSAQTAAQPEGFYRYDKHHLVPFGEFIPWGFRWFVNLMNIPLGDFARGPLAAPSFQVGVQRVAPTICYEDLFGEEIAARFRRPETTPTILANLSNLAWFGESVAIHQHLQIARLRSLEFQLPTVRATNTGATVVIDHLGVVRAALPANERGVLHGDVQGRAGVTPFARWAGAWGLLPLLLAALVGVAAVACWRRVAGARAAAGAIPH
jgi:apolipoprotein N-acyltransferase